MKTHLVIGIVFAAIILGFTITKEEVKGNGTIITKEIEAEDYHSISINENIENRSGSSSKDKYRFSYEQKPGSSFLEISIDENLYPLLDIKFSGGKLDIQTKSKTKIKPTRFIVKGNSEKLNKVEVRGVIDFYSEKPLQTDQLKFIVSGVGDININQLKSTDLECNISGVGNINLKGNADKGKYNLSGVGSINAYDCIVKDLTCHLSGVGNMQVNASEKLNAHNSGVGNMKYKGEASVSKHSSGVGKIKKVD